MAVSFLSALPSTHRVENTAIKSDAWIPEKIITKNYFGTLISNTYV